MKTLEITNQIIDNSIFDDLFFAGQENYSYFWSRDFLYCSEYLIKSEKYRPFVYNNLKKLLEFYNKDFLIPKCLDTRSSTLHIIRNSLRTFCGKEPIPIIHKRNKKTDKFVWKGMYKDHNNSIAIDTNLLFIKACMELNKYDEYKDFIFSIKEKLIDILLFYSKNGYIQIQTGDLIEQPSYSDWKDSLKRKGITFITNLLYWKVLYEMEKSKLFENLTKSEIIRFKIEQTFFHNDSYYSIKDLKNSFGLDENLLAIEWGFITGTRAKTLMTKLINRREFLVVPGLAISPQNSWYNKPIYAYIAGSQGYHDDACWLWIVALASKLAYKFGYINESEKLKEIIEAIIERDQTVYDAYTINKLTNSLERYTTRGFKAEPEWLWGAVYIQDLFENLEMKTVNY
jgi:hypothetical protein